MMDQTEKSLPEKIAWHSFGITHNAPPIVFVQIKRQSNGCTNHAQYITTFSAIVIALSG